MVNAGAGAGWVFSNRRISRNAGKIPQRLLDFQDLSFPTGLLYSTTDFSVADLSFQTVDPTVPPASGNVIGSD